MLCCITAGLYRYCCLSLSVFYIEKGLILMTVVSVPVCYEHLSCNCVYSCVTICLLNIFVKSFSSSFILQATQLWNTVSLEPQFILQKNWHHVRLIEQACMHTFLINFLLQYNDEIHINSLTFNVGLHTQTAPLILHCFWPFYLAHICAAVHLNCCPWNSFINVVSHCKNDSAFCHDINVCGITNVSGF